MPNKKIAWSSWNSILDKNDINKNCVTYWLKQAAKFKKQIITISLHLILLIK